MTALHIASYNGQLEVLKVLIAYGANVDEYSNVSTIYNMIILYIV